MTETSNSGAETMSKRRRRPRRWLRAFLLALGPAVVLAGAGYVYVTGGRYVGTDNAYVRAEKVSVSADISGRVTGVAVKENEVVAAGQVLFRLDEEPLRIALARAKAQLETVHYDIDAMRASYRQKREEMKLADMNQAYAEREFNRQSELASRAIASQSKFDETRNKLDVARQQHIGVKQDLARLVAALAGDVDIPVERHPRYMQAKAEMDQAALDLRRAQVMAPSAGMIAKIDNLRPGDYVKAGTPVFSLVALDRVWIEANMKETDLTYVRAGQRATINVDTYPDLAWTARVDSVSAATGAEFSVLPAQNATGNWVKVVQRIPVRLLIEDAQNKPALRAGMSVEVEIDTGRQRALPGLVKTALAWVGAVE
ncbi:MAG: HlyD family secretion protein [Proteobacteria bacterium]|nr:HlyD family secretion protein [Pseudomonadota bacterium]